MIGGDNDHGPNYWGARKQIIATHTKISTWQHLDLKIIGGAVAPLAPPVDTAL